MGVFLPVLGAEYTRPQVLETPSSSGKVRKHSIQQIFTVPCPGDLEMKNPSRISLSNKKGKH